MKKEKDYTLHLFIAMILFAFLSSCSVFRVSSGHCPSNDKNFFYKHQNGKH